jgi:ABC-type antimicrobial peptide transport system permease subunit
MALRNRAATTLTCWRIQPYAGRLLHASDEHGPNSAPYVVLSYTYWHSHFQDDRGVVGRIVQINKHPFTVIGVAPPSFHGTISFITPDVFVPLVNQEQITGAQILNDRGAHWCVSMTLGHLRPGVTPQQATADLNSIGAWLEKTYPKYDTHAVFSLVPPGLFGSFLGKPMRAFLAGLTLLAGLILLAACANLGSLFAARAADRSREVALRLALGSSRSRILRQLMTEAAIISLAGGALGLTCSIALLQRLNGWQPFPRWPLQVPVGPDPKVYFVALALALMSGFLFGIVPGGQVMRSQSVLRRQGRIDRHAGSEHYPARSAAGHADCDLRRAGNVLDGCRAGAAAFAAQQFRIRPSACRSGPHRSPDGRL